MAFAYAAAAIAPSLCCVARIGFCDQRAPLGGLRGEAGAASFCVRSHAGRSEGALERRKLKSADARAVESAPAKSGADVEIPVSCYQLIGVPDRAEKDEIVKAVMGLKNAEIDEGYTMDVVTVRQDLLMDVRDKLLFEPEYAGNLREKIPPKSSLRIPWSWLPGALCLLQEVGESKLVLEIGQTSLQHQNAKPHTDDLILSMALAECAVAKIGFEKKKVSQGFEALARAQCLLRSKPSLAKMTLLSQIEESLEELAPACTLELLSMPHTPENVDRRRRAILALRELLRQGLDVETSCQVLDWSSFLSQAFDSLLAKEIVDLLPWDNLAAMRKNKKTIESQNLRAVIDSNCFYRIFKAHLAIGFSSKQKEMINKAKGICECLIASEGIDLKFEEAFCLFLLGQCTEAEVVEKLKQLELNSNPKNNSVLGKAIMDSSAVNPSLEMWLKDSVLALYPDTKDCSPALATFFNSQQKFSGSKNSKGSQQMLSTICHRPLSSSGSLERKDVEESRSYMSSSPNLGFAVKQLTPTDLQSSLLSGRNENGRNSIESPVQVKRNLGSQRNSGIWQKWNKNGYNVIKNTYSKLIHFLLLLKSYLSVPPSPTLHTGFTTSILYKTISSGSTLNKVYKQMVSERVLSPNMVWFGDEPSGGWWACDSPNTAEREGSIVHHIRTPQKYANTINKLLQTNIGRAISPYKKINNNSELLSNPVIIDWVGWGTTKKIGSFVFKYVLLAIAIQPAFTFLLAIINCLIPLIDGSIEQAAALKEDAAALIKEVLYKTYKNKCLLDPQERGNVKNSDSDPVIDLHSHPMKP
ncbi:hypothetical protein Fmac_015582 [Flemingia macrophylla]|uniref:Plastid division protein CDP1, chloroplastic n=1 Tax=Flemingia macrophylla TaxID=520843 RepID=A0ABD1MF46_9FABA